MNLEKLNISSSKDSSYKNLLKQCYEYSKKSNHPSTHNAAFIIKNNKIILKGSNILPLGVKEIKKDLKETTNISTQITLKEM
jgi:deoxycytidylate deaminase